MSDRLRPYQKKAVKFLRKRGKAALFLDMGLGKTAIVLSALEERHLPVLVVAPKRVAELVWDSEAEKWRPDLKVSVVKGTPKQREKALGVPADIYVIGRDNVKVDTLKGLPFKTLVIDELSGYKTRSSNRWVNLRFLIRHRAPETVWGLTGTPTPNGYLDLWAQIGLLDDGEHLGKTLTGYRDKYFTRGKTLPNGVVIEWHLRPKADKKILSKVDPIALAMTREGRVALPPVIENEVTVKVPPAVDDLAYQLRTKRVVKVDGVHIVADTPASVGGKLAQIGAGFVYDDGGTPHTLHREKVRAAREVVEGTGSSCLVFYQFAYERDMLLAELDGAETPDSPGVFKRWDQGQVRVLLAHPEAIGHGLNLQHGGHTVIWSSLPWSQEQWAQANNRLIRSGQANPVTIHRIMTAPTGGKPSIDQLVYAALKRKQSVHDYVMSYLEKDK